MLGVTCDEPGRGERIVSSQPPYSPAKGPEKILCIVALVICLVFLGQAIAAAAGLLFYLVPLAVAAFAAGRLRGVLPGGVTRGGGGP